MSSPSNEPLHDQPLYTELIPRPDPSKLTDAAIERATAAYRRELDALRELLSERIITEQDARNTAIKALRDVAGQRLEDLDASIDRRFTLVATLPEQVKADRHADLDHLRGLLETRLSGMDKATELLATNMRAVPSTLDERLKGLRDLIEQRIAAMDKATELLAADLRAVPSNLDERIRGLRELIGERLDAMDAATGLRLRVTESLPEATREQIDQLRQLHEERFGSIAQQFQERDVRTSQAQQASDQALNAALQAAKELVNAQGEASGAAAVKSETSFTKQIDQIGTIISTLEKALDARITELKERIDRGEGSVSGVTSANTEQRLNISQVVAVLAVLATVTTVILLALKK